MSSHMQRIVIAGGGPAAAAAATALRERGHDGSIILACADTNPPYSRPPLSKAYLRADASAEELRLGTADAELLLGNRVIAVDTVARRIRLADGGDLAYDGLVVATGTSAIRPADEAVHVLETLPDADRLAGALGAARSAIVVGSGLLAFELASAAVSRGLDVTLVSRPGAAQRRLGILGGILSSLAIAHSVHLRASGGTFREGRVVLEDGSVLEADLVAAALGSQPNDALLPEHHAPGGGLLVNGANRMAPGIVAAGDVAVRRRADGGRVHDATWTNALAQGDAAAASLLESDPPLYDPVPYGWIEAFGTEIKVAGEIPRAAPPTVVDGDLGEGRALLSWPGAAAAVGYRIPIGRLRRLATQTGTIPV